MNSKSDSFMFTSFSRRKLLSLIAYGIPGAIVVANASFISNIFVGQAKAQETFEGVYKGRKYKIVDNQTSQDNTLINNRFDRPKQLFLDNQEIRIMRDKTTQKYHTPLLFSEFDSPEEVAKFLIDQGIKLPSSEVKLDPNVD